MFELTEIKEVLKKFKKKALSYENENLAYSLKTRLAFTNLNTMNTHFFQLNSLFSEVCN